jgi:hypothetical protein
LYILFSLIDASVKKNNEEYMVHFRKRICQCGGPKDGFPATKRMMMSATGFSDPYCVCGVLVQDRGRPCEC